jgi:hypothetical protein
VPNHSAFGKRNRFGASVAEVMADLGKKSDQGQTLTVTAPKDNAVPLLFRSSRFGFHPRRSVSRPADGRIALGKDFTYLNRYNVGRMCLAVILAAGHAFFACFSCHLGSPRSLRSSHT